VNTRSPNRQLAESDDLERRSRLVSLVYEVLRDMKAPTDDATSMATCSQLSRAFSDKATALANIEAAAPKVRGPTLPASIYSTRT
jgi:hypothetical protein